MSNFFHKNNGFTASATESKYSFSLALELELQIKIENVYIQKYN